MTKSNSCSKISCPVLSVFYIFSRICELCPFPNMPSVCQHQSAVIDSENPSSDHGVLQCDIIYRRPTDYFFLPFILPCFKLFHVLPPLLLLPRWDFSSRCAKRPLAPVRLLLSCPASWKLNRFAPLYLHIVHYIHKMMSILILSRGYILSCDWAVCLSSIVITTWNPCQNA